MELLFPEGKPTAFTKGRRSEAPAASQKI